MSSFSNVLHFGEQTRANQNLNGCIQTWETQVWKQNVDWEGSFEQDYSKFQKALVEVFDAKERRWEDRHLGFLNTNNLNFSWELGGLK